MNQSSIKTLSLTCPSCGGKMKLSADEEKATCSYCGHEMLIDKDEPAQEEYERRMARAHADEDIKDMQIRRERKRRLKGWLIALCVIAAICLVNVFIPGSPMHDLAFPRTADPFAGVSVEFTGMSGEGKATLRIPNGNATEFANETRYEVVPEAGLENGDTVTVKAAAPLGWRFDPAEKQFTVEGLTAWVQSLDQLDENNLAAVHSNTERLIREDWDEIASTSLVQDMTYTPYRMYLFIADEERSYEHNVLYDTYEVNVTREDGSVLTTYEACRYADLKIPADGVLTADFGSLQGFNLGYNYGFSSTHSFSGWTDVAEMEADLRHARDGYHLVN